MKEGTEVLLVEPDQAFHRLVGLVLQRSGFSLAAAVQTAPDALEALERRQRGLNNIDVVVLAPNPPPGTEKDGAQGRRIAAAAGACGVKVVGFSAYPPDMSGHYDIAVDANPGKPGIMQLGEVIAEL